MRLDNYLVNFKLYSSRTKAQDAIKRKEIKVNGKFIDKSSYEVNLNDIIEVDKTAKNFVSNGGYKLEKAFENFDFIVNDKIFCDIGASTGGFTDCLLRHGAKLVYAVDVGESLLSEELKNDKRVISIENFNARNLTADLFENKIDGVVCDVSFISLTYILPNISEILTNNGDAVVLLKPQFECGKAELNKNGIVTNRKAKIMCAQKIYNFALSINLTPVNFTASNNLEGKNTEYLFHFIKNGLNAFNIKKIEEVIL